MDHDQLVDIQRIVGHKPSVGSVETGAELAQRFLERAGSRYGPIPVAPELAALFPSGGLERGHVYGCRGDAWLSLMYVLIAQSTQEGSWVSMINLDFVAMMSAQEQGVALQRVLCVDAKGDAAVWTHVVGACVDGVDIVVVYRPQCRTSDVRRIEARLKAHGSILIVVGDPGAFSPAVVLTGHTTHWDFSTYAMSRSVQVTASGRRMYGSQQCTLIFPRHVSVGAQ